MEEKVTSCRKESSVKSWHTMALKDSTVSLTGGLIYENNSSHQICSSMHYNIGKGEIEWKRQKNCGTTV